MLQYEDAMCFTAENPNIIFPSEILGNTNIQQNKEELAILYIFEFSEASGSKTTFIEIYLN